MLYAAGFRMAGLAHFFDNDVAGSMHGVGKGGLTPLGHQVVRRMETLGMIVDLAHASHATVADVLAMAARPVVFSHGGVQATCKVNRNLTDEVEFRGEPARTRVQPRCQDQVPDEINLSCRGSETALPPASRFLFGRFHPGSAFAKYVRTTRVLGDQGHRNGIC